MKLKILAEVKKYIHYSMWLRQCKIIWIPAGWIFTTYNTIRMIGDRRGTWGGMRRGELKQSIREMQVCHFWQQEKITPICGNWSLNSIFKRTRFESNYFAMITVCRCWSLSPVWQCRTQQWTQFHCPAGREEPASKRSLSSKSPCQWSESFRNH